MYPPLSGSYEFTMMPKTPVDECPAGPAMDAAVAKALGYECVCDEEPSDCPVHCNDPDVRFRYSTDISAAWGLDGLGWLWGFKEESRGLNVTIYNGGVGTLACTFVEWDGAKTTYELIKKAYALGRCRAFLKANGVTEILEEPT